MPTKTLSRTYIIRLKDLLAAITLVAFGLGLMRIAFAIASSTFFLLGLIALSLSLSWPLRNLGLQVNNHTAWKRRVRHPILFVGIFLTIYVGAFFPATRWFQQSPLGGDERFRQYRIAYKPLCHVAPSFVASQLQKSGLTDLETFFVVQLMTSET